MLEEARKALWQAREPRPKPFRDEKVLAAWNGLMIGPMADGGATLERADMLSMAKRAMDDVMGTMWREGRLFRIRKDGKVQGTAFLDDYAELAFASIDLYEATFDPAHVERAAMLADAALERFWDRDAGGFFFTPHDGETLIHRAKDLYDQAVPSGASSMAHVLIRLSSLTGRARYVEHAERSIELAIGQALEQPFAFSHLLGAADRIASGQVEVVLVGDRTSPELLALAAAARRVYLPNRVLAHVDPASPRDDVPLLAGKTASGGRATAYVCLGRTCSAPLTDAGELRSLLEAGGPR
jgi:uncharacterized protein YyaL (SSP411 family)